VDLHSLSVERVRDFGKVYLALALWRRLGLSHFLEQTIAPGREQIGWEQIACLLVLGRFCAQESELALSEHWFHTTALDDLLGIDASKINDDRLYRGLDALLPHKDALFGHLQERYSSWFGTRFEFLLYDVTSTYFEGQGVRNEHAKRGYSRDHRSDCVQVCIGLVVTPEGLPVAYEMFDGNRADVTTVEDIVDLMEGKYGQAERIWVMDRGMVSEDNLDYLREKGARYIVGTPKSQLKHFEKDLLEESDWSEVEPGLEVKLVSNPDGAGDEQYVLCRSASRGAKESAMLVQQRKRLRAKLDQIDKGLRKRGQKTDMVWKRIGRWLGRYTLAEKIFSVEVELDRDKQACGLRIIEDESRLEWAGYAHGAYLLRTNCIERDPRQLWRWYIQLTQAEAAFRTTKSDLGLRPIYHQKTDRVQAHVLVCFLALALWRSLEMWMKAKGLGTSARQLLKEMNTIRSMDVILQVKNDRKLRLRMVGKPDNLAADLLDRLGLKMPGRSKRIENVVEN